jgi:anti-anti-sigma factor
MTQFRPFSATVRSANGAAIIDLHGEINANAEAVLNGAYAEAMAGQPGRLLLNFGDVDYINSTGIALIVGGNGRKRRTSGTTQPSARFYICWARPGAGCAARPGRRIKDKVTPWQNHLLLKKKPPKHVRAPGRGL